MRERESIYILLTCRNTCSIYNFGGQPKKVKIYMLQVIQQRTLGIYVCYLSYVSYTTKRTQSVDDPISIQCRLTNQLSIALCRDEFYLVDSLRIINQKNRNKVSRSWKTFEAYCWRTTPIQASQSSRRRLTVQITKST
jgi:hypothetical protein